MSTLPPAAVSPSTRAVVVDTAARTLAEVEHLVHRLDPVLDELFADGTAGPTPYVVSSHVVRSPPARHSVVLSWSGGPEQDAALATLLEHLVEHLVDHRVELELVDGALVAEPTLAADAPGTAQEAIARRTGRLCRYPGQAAVETDTTVARVVAESGVDVVEALAGVEVASEASLDLSGFARPTWRDGETVLLVQQARGVLIPFEVRDQIPCCADH